MARLVEIEKILATKALSNAAYLRLTLEEENHRLFMKIFKNEVTIKELENTNETLWASQKKLKRQNTYRIGT